MSNLLEYLAGTDPLDAQSCLKLNLQGVDAGTGRPQITFTAMPGIGYTLQYSDNVTSGIWHKLNDLPADLATRIITLNDPAPRPRRAGSTEWSHRSSLNCGLAQPIEDRLPAKPDSAGCDSSGAVTNATAQVDVLSIRLCISLRDGA